METGTVAVNTGVVALPEAPFGGINKLDMVEGGSMAIKDYLNIKYTLVLNSKINELLCLYAQISKKKPVTCGKLYKKFEK